MISIDSALKEYPNKLLFNNLSLKLNEGMRVGLVGRNGSGKSTLLKIILGLESLDSGKIDIAKTASIGYLPQEIIPGTKNSIIEETLAAFPKIKALEQQIQSVNIKLKTDSQNNNLLNHLSILHNEFEQIDGWNIEKKAKVILGGLGFTEDQFIKPFDSFSGGWRMRCYLAGILLKEPNFLFLDEPTNHLDLNAIIWMETFLSKWNGGLLMISHDRNFLDKSVNNILELDRFRGNLYSGNYSNYILKCEEKKIHIEKAYNNQQKLIKDTEKFIERFRAKDSKAKQVQSRIKQLNKLKIIDPVNTNKRLSINISEPKRGPLKVVELNNVTKSFGQNIVYSNLNLIIERGQKIGLVGENGAGKSTLLKMLANVEDPSTGIISFGANINVHYFGQHQVESLNMNETIFNTISSISSDWSQTKIRSYLGSFFFEKDMVENKVKVLSGGEKSRLALAKLLVKPANLILLDEPTNHLDIDSRNIIEIAFKNYLGTLVCISHDRHFLNEVTNHTIEVQDCSIKVFLGNYDYYLDKKNQTKINDNHFCSNKKLKTNKETYKQIKHLKNRKVKIKNRINSIETELEKISKKLLNDNISSNYEKLQSLQIKQNNLELEYIELIEELEKIELDNGI